MLANRVRMGSSIVMNKELVLYDKGTEHTTIHIYKELEDFSNIIIKKEANRIKMRSDLLHGSIYTDKLDMSGYDTLKVESSNGLQELDISNCNNKTRVVILLENKDGYKYDYGSHIAVKDDYTDNGFGGCYKKSNWGNNIDHFVYKIWLE